MSRACRYRSHRLTAPVIWWSYGSLATQAGARTGTISAKPRRFLTFAAKPLAEVRLGDVQAFAASLDCLAPATRANIIAAVKSLLT